ncbi:MAG: hypothetical protein K9H15_12520 [Bacteroidales bacterium]|nr:hypothetical protein [Bacteroidales bacterium]
MVKLLLIGLIVYLLDIPFGYWRANVKRLSAQWFLAIHIAVLLVIALRLVSHIGFDWYTYVVLVTAFFLGQQTGSVIIRRLRKSCDQISSCMVMDLVRCCQH